MRQDLIEFERDEISMAKELNKKIGTNITTIRESLEKIEARFTKNNNIAAFVMESGPQMAGGVIIYPKGFQKKIK